MSIVVILYYLGSDDKGKKSTHKHIYSGQLLKKTKILGWLNLQMRCDSGRWLWTEGTEKRTGTESVADIT